MAIINLMHDDSLSAMRGMKDKSYQLAIVDVPYGININHNIGRRKGDAPSSYKPVVWDNDSPDVEYFDQLFRVSENQIIWGANHFISKMPRDSSCWLMWDKGFSGDVSFAQFELAWTSFNSTCKKYDKHPGTIKNRIHPTEKPIKLYSWLLKNYAKPGDKILDTHAGSFSIGIACDIMGYDIDAYEIDLEYYTAAKARLARHQQQATLFTADGLHLNGG